MYKIDKDNPHDECALDDKLVENNKKLKEVKDTIHTVKKVMLPLTVILVFGLGFFSVASTVNAISFEIQTDPIAESSDWIEDLEDTLSESDQGQFVQDIAMWFETIMNETEGEFGELNETEMFQELLNDDELMQSVWDSFEGVDPDDITLDMLIEAIYNSSYEYYLGEDVAKAWISNAIRKAINQTLPESWFEPLVIIVSNEGLLDFSLDFNIAMYNEGETPNSIISTHISGIDSSKNGTIEIEPASIVNGFVNTTVDVMTDVIYDNIVANHTLSDSISDQFLERLLLETPLYADIQLGTNIGLMGFNSETTLNVTQIFQQLEEDS